MPRTPFDKVVERIAANGYHNHRQPQHSDLVSELILQDLKAKCATIRQDLDGGEIRAWENVSTPGGRGRRIDLLLAKPAVPASAESPPAMSEVRLVVENKSVITAHRNKDARFDDLLGVLDTIHGERPEAVIAATVLIGTAPRVMNIPDNRKRFDEHDFEQHVRPRLSTGDQTLWDEFPWAISKNKPQDAMTTRAKFESLPRRAPARTHVRGYDHLLLVPLYVDNVAPPHVDRKNPLGIDVDKAYAEFIAALCKAYTVRWHP